MNDPQRVVLREQIKKLETAINLINEAKNNLLSANKFIEEIKEQEEWKIWNMGEFLSGTERYKKIEELADRLGDVAIDIDIIDTDDMCRDISQSITNIESIIAA